MREYKRLTKHVGGKLVLAKDETAYSEIYYESLLIKRALQRLAELEDKIEAGTLVELPCKVGDKVYVIPSYTNVKLNLVCKKCGINTDMLNKVTSPRIDHITFYKDDYTIFNECEMIGRGESFGETWFLTYEEAEAKLKEYIEKSKALLEK